MRGVLKLGQLLEKNQKSKPRRLRKNLSAKKPARCKTPKPDYPTDPPKRKKKNSFKYVKKLAQAGTKFCHKRHQKKTIKLAPKVRVPKKRTPKKTP